MGRACEGLLRKGVGERLGWGTEGTRDKGQGGYCWRLGGFRRKEGSGAQRGSGGQTWGFRELDPQEARAGRGRPGSGLGGKGGHGMVVGEE